MRGVRIRYHAQGSKMRRLKKVVQGLLAVVLVMSLTIGSTALAATIYQFYNSGDEGSITIYGDIWQAQMFTVAVPHSCDSVRLKGYRTGAPGTITVSLRATTDGEPSGEDLAVGTYEGGNLLTDEGGTWFSLQFAEGYSVSAQKYALVVRCAGANSSNSMRWRCDYSEPSYTGGSRAQSDNEGVTWTIDTVRDMMFEEWSGAAGVESATALTQAATDVGYNEVFEWFEATLNGKVVDDGGEPCSACFYYRVKDAEEWSWGGVAGTYETDEVFDIELSCLLSNEVYEFLAMAWNSENVAAENEEEWLAKTETGAILEFDTGFEECVPTVMTWQYPIEYVEDDVRIFGEIGYDGGSKCDAWFQWKKASLEEWNTQVATSLVSSGDMELQNPLNDWIISGADATMELSTEQVKSGTYSMKVTRVGVNARAYQDIEEYGRYQGKDVTMGAWVWASVADRVKLQIDDAVGSMDSSYHTGGSTWEWIEITREIAAQATRIRLFLSIYDGDTSAYFDDVSMVRGANIDSGARYCELLETSGDFDILVLTVEEKVLYDFRAFAENDEGIGSGGIAEFCYQGVVEKPEAETVKADFESATTAMIYGKNVDDGGVACISRFQYRKVGDTLWLQSHVVMTETGDTYNLTIENLTPNTSYEYRAHLWNSAGIGYGGIKVFHTFAVHSVPTIRSMTAEWLNSTSVELCGYVANDGGYDCAVWFRYRWVGGGEWIPTDKALGAVSYDEFYRIVFDLDTGRWYEWQACGSNELGTGYGVVKSFDMEETEPEEPAPPVPGIPGIPDAIDEFIDSAVGHWLILISAMMILFVIFRKYESLRIVFPLLAFGAALVAGWIAAWVVILLALGAGISIYSILKGKMTGGGS